MDTRLESQISETASHSATKLHSYIDRYPAMCYCNSKKSQNFQNLPDNPETPRFPDLFELLLYLQFLLDNSEYFAR